MKNQYVGDIGDYGKYGLLRFLAERGIQIGVNWYLTKDEKNKLGDGKFTDYLEQENEWKYLLFVRDRKRDEFGFTNAYYFLGEMEYDSSHGECPMNVIWNMKNDIPGNILELTMAV